MAKIDPKNPDKIPKLIIGTKLTEEQYQAISLAVEEFVDMEEKMEKQKAELELTNSKLKIARINLDIHISELKDLTKSHEHLYEKYIRTRGELETLKRAVYQ